MDGCKEVLEKLRSKRCARPFLNPIDAMKLGLVDYHDIIKKPMDLQTIEKKLESGCYAAPGDFVDDVRLIFFNCYRYNPPAVEVVRLAWQLQEIFELEWAKAMDDLPATPRISRESTGCHLAEILLVRAESPHNTATTVQEAHGISHHPPKKLKIDLENCFVPPVGVTKSMEKTGNGKGLAGLKSAAPSGLATPTGAVSVGSFAGKSSFQDSFHAFRKKKEEREAREETKRRQEAERAQSALKVLSVETSVPLNHLAPVQPAPSPFAASPVSSTSDALVAAGNAYRANLSQSQRDRLREAERRRRASAGRIDLDFQIHLLTDFEMNMGQNAPSHG